MIKKTLLIVFLTNICLPSVQGWESKLREDGKLIISNLSLNEERVFSSRVRGKLSIILDNQNLLLAINWGDFANLSDANVFYNICLLYTSPSPRDNKASRMPSSA